MGLLNNFLSFMPNLAAVAGDLKMPGGMWEWLLIKGFGWIKDYGWRIIVFIIFLKLLLLPLDIFQRYKMRKNQKINERIKPQLEEMQKRYGNDKALLSQKQMELNKKEGFSYFSSCIPMILTLVIFFTLLQGMNNISQYMIFRQYAEWYDTYTVTLAEEESKLGAEYSELIAKIDADNRALDGEKDENGNVVSEGFDAKISRLYIGLLQADSSLEGKIPNRDDIRAADKDNNNADDDRMSISDWEDALNTLISDENYSNIKTDLVAYKEAVIEYFNIWDELKELNSRVTDLRKPAIQAAQQAVVAYNMDNADNFLWIKSIWQPDTTWSSPVFDDENSFRAAVSSYIGYSQGCGSCNSGKNKTGLPQETLDKMMSRYGDVTAGILSANKDQHNGYFILVALVVCLSFLSQWITQRLQKKSGQFEANGAAGGGTMKVMMFMMPILLGIFAIRYTAAFSLYMVTNSAMTILINTVVTLIMNAKDKRSKVKVVTEINKYGRPDPRDFQK